MTNVWKWSKACLFFRWRRRRSYSIFDVVIDIGILSQIIPDISARFGLSPDHITVYDPETKQIHWNELRKRGFEFSGLVVARTAVKSHSMA